jgi:hypothetical protein
MRNIISLFERRCVHDCPCGSVNIHPGGNLIWVHIMYILIIFLKQKNSCHVHANVHLKEIKNKNGMSNLLRESDL